MSFSRARTCLAPALVLIPGLHCLFTPGLSAQDPFAEGVRPTPWQSAEAEQASFRLPPGFEIQLVAAEPEIQKPMNLAFDERGRIWVTDTVEYPWPAPPDRPGRDTLKILEDRDGDGRAELITTFADGLNVPIGVYPHRGGAIVWSIPFIWHLKDNDGDGKCDERVKLYGPMGFERDTHGMNNAFRRGFDGWLYACHGFNNVTTVHGSDGHEIQMQSGNTYRMRVDGTRVEQFTHGQVNPFGMCLDELGNIFSADCHTRPITALLRGGYYESFGKPHDGLGFVPEIMQHLHGSTANCGIVVYQSDHFPAEFRGSVFTGNVMTSRVNRDVLDYTGTTPRAVEAQDLLATTDPWFRPVDLEEAPDGSLYVADFYNRIIGHYEVPLTHPGRDRTSGRIWRVVARGPGSRPPERPADMSRATAEELVALLAHPVLTTRLLATSALADRIGAPAVALARKALHGGASPLQRAHALWVLHRLRSITTEDLKRAAGDSSPVVRTHAQRALGEGTDWNGALEELAVAGLGDQDSFVRRAAAEALGQHPAPAHLARLLASLRGAAPADSHLVYTIRRAIRNVLAAPGGFEAIRQEPLDREGARLAASCALSVESPEAASWLLAHLRSGEADGALVVPALRHAARHASPAEVDSLAALAEERYPGDVDLQVGILSSILEGLAQRGAAPGAALLWWGDGLVGRLLGGRESVRSAWTHHPLAEGGDSRNPWVLQARDSADGVKGARFVTSLPRGEQLTGRLASPPFTLQDHLSFFLAGHAGFPDRPAHGRNLVRLVEASTGAVLREVAPPRNDLAQKVEWSLGELAGRRATLEVIDGDAGDAYAWLALGRIEPAGPELPGQDPASESDHIKAAAQLASSLHLRERANALRAVLESPATDAGTQAAVAAALLALDPAPIFGALVPLLGAPEVPARLRAAASAALGNRNDPAARSAIEEAMKTVPSRLAAAIAQALAGEKPGGELLLVLVQKGLASARLLQTRGVVDRLRAAGLEQLDERIQALTQGLASDAEARDALIQGRKKAYQAAQPSSVRGAAVFEKNCTTCHQIGGKGKVVGPQLDGIGNRGLDRVLEDMLDPNRNVDVAFRATTLVLKDGNVFSGLFRRQEGETAIFADAKGEEVSFSTGRIEQQVKGETSLMPENFGEVLPEGELLDLLAFLLASRGARE